jgi:hypothetical protein
MTSSNDGAITSNYAYDGNGNRVQASSGSSGSDTTNYLWDDNAAGGLPQLAVERDGAGAELRRYSYGADRISVTSGGAAYYYHYDQLRSVTNVTSASGVSEWTYAYDPFGAPRSNDTKQSQRLC